MQHTLAEVCTDTTKRLHLLRHGQAAHNPRAEAAREAGCSFDDFLRLMKEDDAFDADLTDLGRQQARAAAAQHSGTADNIQLVVSSPLSRALDTAMLVLPEATARGPFMAHDELRERSGWMLNAKRRRREELIAKYPSCDFTHPQTEDDELWTEDELEPTVQTAERGYAFLRWLSERDEREIAVVAHGGLFSYLLNANPRVHAEGAAAKRFGNTELRSLELSWSGSGDDRVFTLSSAAGAAE